MIFFKSTRLGLHTHWHTHTYTHPCITWTCTFHQWVHSESLLQVQCLGIMTFWLLSIVFIAKLGQITLLQQWSVHDFISYRRTENRKKHEICAIFKTHSGQVSMFVLIRWADIWWAIVWRAYVLGNCLVSNCLHPLLSASWLHNNMP